MTQFTRKNAWNQGGTFENPDLLWYAKGVGVMQERALNDPTSWWFFAAIHGEYVSPENREPAFPGWQAIPGPPVVPTEPLPSQELFDLYWNQCQHQSWYFIPWHRGYLIALEAHIRAAVVSLGGPEDWALPYWNYFGPNDEYKMPPAFAQPTLPDGTNNPLFVKARYGPQDDGDIYITSQVTAKCQTEPVYTNSYGGPRITSFWHGGGTSGLLEANPHNLVHVDVGGDGEPFGLMSDPGTAGLDPIFYLHHCNIDRMWAAWNQVGHANPSDPAWLQGPAAHGDRAFAMPLPSGEPWLYTPGDMTRLEALDFRYDDLTTGLPSQVSDRLANRLRFLGVVPDEDLPLQGGQMEHEEQAELLGAQDGALRITSSGARAKVKLDVPAQQQMTTSFRAASEASPPDRVYLRLENVRGDRDALKLNVTVNQQDAGPVALFGLRRATLKDGPHGGGGLTFELEITHIMDKLFLDQALDAAALDVRIEPNHAVPESSNLTVGRVSVYRVGQS